jgi:DNA/RNA endonuclease G (NUC1)
MRPKYVLLFAAIIVASTNAPAQSPLSNCSEQFIGGSTDNAPTILSSPPGETFGTNRHLCYRGDGASFFAAEYWPDEFAPRWAAYRLSPGNYGPNGCQTYTRQKANCYFKEETWAEVGICTEASDPFHGDHMLGGAKLGKNDFSNTGHDRGHIAPRQAFSWHVCATYQTFSMANMSPQRAFLNQNLWQYLERQVLTWAVDEGPVYVVTGTTFRHYPHDSFEVYTSGDLDDSMIYRRTSRMLGVTEQHKLNFESNPSGHVLKPKRTAKPNSVKPRSRNLRMPTGYYKVIYRPAFGTEPAHAIGFLLPHTFENLNNLPDVDPKETFWAFVSRIDLIEATSATTFPGIPEHMKSAWGDSFFESRRTGRNIRPNSCGAGTPQGVMSNTTKAQRLAACTEHLN